MPRLIQQGKIHEEVRTFVKQYGNFLTSWWTLVRINLQTAAEVRTFVEEYVNFLTSLWTLARINLQTAAEVRTFVKKYVNFLTSFWTGRRFSAILLNGVFVLYVFYHVLRSAPYPDDGHTIKGFRAQPPGKPVRMRIKMAAEVQTFVKE